MARDAWGLFRFEIPRDVLIYPQVMCRVNLLELG